MDSSFKGACSGFCGSLKAQVASAALDAVEFPQAVVDLHAAGGVGEVKAFECAANGVQFAIDQHFVSAVQVSAVIHA